MSKIYVLLLTKNKTVHNLKSTLLFLCICFISSNVFGQTKWVGVGSLSPAVGATTNFNFSGNWSTNKVPSATDDVVIDFNNNNLISTIDLSLDAAIKNLTITVSGNNQSGTLNVADKTLTVNGFTNADILSPNPNTTLSIGVTTPSLAGSIDFKSDATFGLSNKGFVYFIGNVNSKIIFRGNLNLGLAAATVANSEPGTVVFDGIGNQNYIHNNTTACNFNHLIIGNQNSPTVILGGLSTVDDNILGNLTVNHLSVLNLSSNQLNRRSNGGVFLLKDTSQLILGGINSFANGGSATLISGSNFPSGFSTVALDSTSTVEFNGAAQTIPGAANAVLSYGNLTLSIGNVKTLGSNIAIFRCLTLANNATMALGNFDAVLKSNNVTTAYVAAVPISPNFTYGTGRFEVERYLYPQKSWRLLSVPFQKFANDATASTINSSWREGGNSLSSSGYGTRITGPTGTNNPSTASTAILDEYTQRGSMKYYDMANNNYIEINSLDLAANKTIANDEGYYVFIRGDRGINVAGGAMATTLRARGKIRTSNQIYLINANSFQSVGNPYPSRIQFSSITKSATMENSFTAWNPTNIGGGYGVGRFQQYIYNGSDYASIFGIKNFIESGEAFFVSNTGAGTGTITIKESDKGAGSSLYSRVGITSPTLEINLYTKATDNTDFKVDGTVLNFDPLYSNSINNDDVKKFSNVSDNLYILKNNTKLFAERRPTLQINDTISLALTNTRLGPYRFNIDPSVLSNLNLKAYLQDKFLQTESPVSLSETTDINFDITNDPNSRVADRFMIVFKKFLPLRFTAITAVRKGDKSINLTWNTENENNIDNYKIERSIDGVNFIEIGSQMPTANNFGNPYYTFYDAKASKEIIYYRIKGNGITGNSIYSNTAKVLALEENNNKQVNIFPNPVTNGNININFEGAVFGNYVITINDFTGQLIKSETFRHQVTGESCIIKISNAGGGFYTANIVDETGIKKMIPFLIK